MLEVERTYTLRSSDNYVHITIKPCGTIELDIPQTQQHLMSELDKVHFKLNEVGVLLVCNERGCSVIEEVSLKLSRRDTFDLYAIVDDMLEEYERLMTDL